jgi:2-aminoadipate transaminase
MSPNIEFDRWKHLYAERIRVMQSSAIRDLMAFTARPDIISLAGGLPYTDAVGYDRVARAASEALEMTGPEAMQYGTSEGYRPLKYHIKGLMADEGVSVDEGDIVVTQGAQQALEFSAKIFVDQGDAVILEGPSYAGAIQAFTGYLPKFVHIPMDDDGMIVDELQAALKENAGKVKFIYTIPNFQNPAGVTLSFDRRVRLLALAREHGAMVIEDNPYGRLRFEGEDVPCLRSMDDDVIYLGTFSKVFSPGLRVGWVVAPEAILDKYVKCKQAGDLCSSSFAQHVLDRYFHENSWTANVEVLRDIYRERRDAMLAALDEYFPPEATWTRPQGGFFVWATLPEWLDTGEMLARALEAKVAYVPGDGFYADGSGKNSMRLNFSYPKPEQIHEAIKRLGKVIKEQMALYRSLVGWQDKGPSESK